MSDSSSAELLAGLNRVQKRWDRSAIVATGGGIISLYFLSTNLASWVWVLWLLALVAAIVYARHIDVLNGTVLLQYSLEDDAGKQFAQLQNAFGQLAQCRAVWHVAAAGHTDDWKRNAGVSTLTKRSAFRPGSGVSSKLHCNIKVPMLNAGRTTLYFFPDRLLVYNSGGVGAVSYDHLRAEAGQVRFVEDDGVPSDASQVGTTWRYVNKKGGPDRRFNNNRQLPIMLYGQLLLTSASGLRELFEMSVPAAAAAVSSALADLKTKTLSASSNH